MNHAESPLYYANGIKLFTYTHSWKKARNKGSANAYL